MLKAFVIDVSDLLIFWDPGNFEKIFRDPGNLAVIIREIREWDPSPPYPPHFDI